LTKHCYSDTALFDADFPLSFKKGSFFKGERKDPLRALAAISATMPRSSTATPPANVAGGAGVQPDDEGRDWKKINDVSLNV